MGYRFEEMSCRSLAFGLATSGWPLHAGRARLELHCAVLLVEASGRGLLGAAPAYVEEKKSCMGVGRIMSVGVPYKAISSIAAV